MSFWEWNCAVSGYIAANRTAEAPAPGMSEERLAELGIEGF